MTIFMLTILFGALVGTAVGLVWSIGANLRQGRAVREDMAARLEALPLAQALRQHALEPRTVLHARPLVEIEGLMRACADCHTTAACGEVLARRAAREALGFCPNHDAIGMLAAAPAAA